VDELSMIITRKMNYDVILYDLVSKFEELKIEICNKKNIDYNLINKLFLFFNENKYYIKRYIPDIYEKVKIFINNSINILSKNKKLLIKNKEVNNLYTELFYLKYKLESAD